ncbi:MAG: S-layer homology domain-containing protein [Ruminococcaceae bacterium]|nr:S-layer homology domain-containing protein [Oscillospiraceae bacterium]
MGSKKKIVEGYGDGNFGVNDDITREQLVTILYRYAQYKGYDVSVGENTNILSYDDSFSISEYAYPALQWACGAGIIGGDDGYLLPQNDAMRGQVAAILCRFNQGQNVEKKREENRGGSFL